MDFRSLAQQLVAKKVASLMTNFANIGRFVNYFQTRSTLIVSIKSDYFLV